VTAGSGVEEGKGSDHGWAKSFFWVLELDADGHTLKRLSCTL
jgi:hypothetical protein